MKKFTVILAVCALFLCSTTANAEGLIFKGGLAYTSGTEIKDVKINGYTGWMFGAGYETGSVAGLSLQPEILYKVKGAKFEDATKVQMNYLEIPVNVQWGLDLLLIKPFVFAGPFVGFNLSNKFSNETTYAEAFKSTIKKLEYGFGAGFGLDLFKFQLTAKYNWNFGGVADWSAYKADLQGISVATGTLELSIGLKF